MLTSNDDDFAERARSLANHGRIQGKSFYEHFRVGTNMRMTGFEAAVLLAQFERLPEQIARRSRNATLLKRLLADVEQIVWQRETAGMTQNSYYLMPGRLRGSQPNRDQFHRALTAAGVPCTPFYPHPLYGNPVYQQPESCRVMPCPNAEACVRDAFWLPHRLLLAEEDTIHEVAEIIRQAVRGVESPAPMR